ncbi:carboxylesterase family protein [Hyphococcus flavus]|uniref:Carboxylic ester hydrolase n=1 Tax=Hyphococcus flavus TaxID=1866326 RepID=A0AAE9ZE48_9PROT|nr:carboxylesterase family protein [Hyphococcus flavus]WDI32926.1 carboxylesterase family protein [Hyphococcus flavus]
MKFRLVVLACFTALAACGKKVTAPPAPEPDEATVRQTSLGEVIGVSVAEGAHAWRGLPYAKPPVGNLRWRAPQPAANWDGVRVAAEFSSRCTQMSNWFHQSEGIDPGQVIGSEDCLYLDLYAPADAMEKAASGEPLPVMVWIHGGSNVWGRSASYVGSNLARNEGVIVISVQYRLGPLGFFSHPALRADAQTSLDSAANFATLDLIQSLKWVRDNISSFGGDPERVTVFGESAGGHNVVTLLASPLAAGLFHRAIVQSGSFDSVSIADAESAESALSNPSMVVSERLGAETAKDLRALSAEALFAAYEGAEGATTDMPTVIEDGVVLPSGAMRDAFSSPDTFNAVPIITGVNRDEFKLFNLANPRLTKQFLGLFTTSRDKEFYDAASEYPSRIWRIRSVDEPAVQMAAGGHNEVYAYRFDWDEGGRFMFSDLKHLLGAAHAMEIPFVFNRFQLLGRLDKVMFQKKTAASREELSRAMGAYWAEFARNGAPAPDGLPAWPEWSANGGTLLRFDGREDGGIVAFAEEDNLAMVASDIVADQRMDQKERCYVIGIVGVWLPELANGIAVETGCA